MINSGMGRVTKNIDGTVWLREKGLRVTARRIEIIELLDASPVPLTLAEINDKITGKGCFATVFRFMSELERQGLVEKVAWVDGTTRHEIRDQDHHHHHHYLICRTCQKVEEIEECVVMELENKIALSRGYSGITHSLQLSGVCPTCQKNRRNRPKKSVRG